MRDQNVEINPKIAAEFTTSLNLHIACVHEAGRKLGIHQKQLDLHDLSKWKAEEFNGYALHFHGGGAPDKFARAWLHHIHHNPHHWQHWIFPDGHTPRDSSVVNGVVEIPEDYALEMVADWMGAQKAYGGTWDMTKWLTGHIPKIRVHPRTADFLIGVLDGLGYADIVYLVEFGVGLTPAKVERMKNYKVGQKITTEYTHPPVAPEDRYQIGEEIKIKDMRTQGIVAKFKVLATDERIIEGEIIEV